MKVRLDRWRKIPSRVPRDIFPLGAPAPERPEKHQGLPRGRRRNGSHRPLLTGTGEKHGQKDLGTFFRRRNQFERGQERKGRVVQMLQQWPMRQRDDLSNAAAIRNEGLLVDRLIKTSMTRNDKYMMNITTGTIKNITTITQDARHPQLLHRHRKQ